MTQQTTLFPQEPLSPLSTMSLRLQFLEEALAEIAGIVRATATDASQAKHLDMVMARWFEQNQQLQAMVKAAMSVEKPAQRPKSSLILPPGH